MDLTYDYIICGAGAAGLSLAIKLCESEFIDKNILVIDKSKKDQNDRTWCFWEKGAGRFDTILKHKWPKILFANNDFSKEINIAPYTYKMMRGLDFYQFCMNKIEKSNHITFLNEDIATVQKGSVITQNNTYKAKYIFTSIIDFEVEQTSTNYVAQHFGGWYIKTQVKQFDTEVATFMDFRNQEVQQCRFAYVLPFSDSEALVEIASFSNDLISDQVYDEMLQKYISVQLGVEEYEIVEKEYGNIPMTVFEFEKYNQEGLYYIGTAGGAVKASTGYAFDKIQKQTDVIISQMRAGKEINPTAGFHPKYRWMDRIFLNVLLKNRHPMDDVFGRIFKKVPAKDAFAFLAEHSSLAQDLKVIQASPKLPFIKALVHTMR